MREFSLLHEVSAALAQGFELREAMQSMFRKVTDASGLRRGLLTIVSRESGDMMLEEMEGAQPAWTHRPIGKVGIGLCGGVAASGESFVRPRLDAAACGSWTAGEREILAEAIAAGDALIVVPIRHANEVLGTLSFTRPAGASGPAALEVDERFLVLVAGQVGLAVRFRQVAKERLDVLRQENARLQE